MSMQMDAEFKNEQIDALFIWVGALEGGSGGWEVPQGCPPQKLCVPSIIYKNSLLRTGWIFA